MAARTGHLGPTVFRSLDGGETWKEASRPPAFRKAAEGEKGRVVDHVFWLTPGHSREPNAWYAGTSPQGLFRSEDGGDTWDPAAGFNDHPMRPKWCGDEAPQGTPDGSKLHSILIDPRDPKTAWVFPMDGTEVWPRVSPGGKPAAYVTRDSGQTWQRLDRGLPRSQGWLTVKRQAMSGDAHEPIGIYFGTTSGEVWASTNEGAEWTCIARHLPEIYAVEATEL